MRKFPYDPGYGLPDAKRSEIIDDAIALGIAIAAAHHRVHISSIYRWMSDLGIDTKNNGNTSHTV
jgi:hypothetical protein